jgi:hypothetical protein
LGVNRFAAVATGGGVIAFLLLSVVLDLRVALFAALILGGTSAIVVRAKAPVGRSKDHIPHAGTADRSELIATLVAEQCRDLRRADKAPPSE